MILIANKTGLILFTHNNFKLTRPLTLVSGIIHFFQTGRLKNGAHLPTHTAQTIVINDILYVIDSDYDGVKPQLFEDWKKGRAWLHVFDPNILTEVTGIIYVNKALDKSGSRYGFEDIGSWLKYQVNGKFKGESNPEKADDTMICSYFTAYLYNYAEWWKRSPLNLWQNKLKDAPNGVLIASDRPDNINFY